MSSGITTFPPCFFTAPVGACAVFMLLYGRNLLFSLFAFSMSLSGVPSFDFPSKLLRPSNSSYAWYGFLNRDLFLAAADCFGCLSGVTLRLFGAGWNDSSSTCTKLDGKRPTALGSRRKRPIHQDPSPALRASMRSPSMKPRSFLVSPPHEYVALHQHGNRGSSSDTAILARRRSKREWCDDRVFGKLSHSECYGSATVGRWMMC